MVELENFLEKIIDYENLEDFIKDITEKTRRILGAERCTLFLYYPEDESLRSIVFHADMEKMIDISLNEKSIAGYVFKNNVMVNIKDVNNKEELKLIDKDISYHDCWANINTTPTKSMLVIPVIFKNEVIGVLSIVNKFPQFTKEDEKTGSELGKLIGYILKNFLKKLELINLNNINETIISSINEGVILTDSKDRIVKVNYKFLEMIGFRYSYEQLIDKRIYDVLPLLESHKEKIELAKNKRISQDVTVGIIRIKVIPIFINHIMNNLLKNLVYIVEY
ncbi:GAF domain-containing protein [Sulfurihydrogenibium subterraneum]|uniref:GAF domain-containing protein n=1 Tax=Sulfurihydrogenibium subterraneum TaxID=171121 RepID=UPI00048EA5EE|nr:GAF domain-containing protein [Sulfurihydrogenibium subterraneum]